MSQLAQLRSLASDPQAQAAYAVTLLQPRQRRDVLLAALQVLAQEPVPEARPALLQIYQNLAAIGPKRDPGAYMRRALIDALRPVATPADVPWLYEAVTTYEFLPPDFKEDAILLRAGALLVLNQLDDTLAGYAAVRLLVDEHTGPMSGEPAVTAARVLASQGQLLPLYQVAMQPAPTLPEVVSECLRSLGPAPSALVHDLLSRHGDSPNSLVRIGLIDLLIDQRALPEAAEYLANTLNSPSDPDVYRYQVMAMLNARSPELKESVLRSARFTTDQSRVKALLEVLEIYAADPEVAETVQRLNNKARR